MAALEARLSGWSRSRNQTTQQAKEQGLLTGNKRESGVNLGRLGSQPMEVKTHSVFLRTGFLSEKNPQRVTGWLELVAGCCFC